jgi:hypothetical protein
VALETPPDQRLVDLVGAQQQWKAGQKEVAPPAGRLAEGVDPEGRNDGAADQITLGGEAHSGHPTESRPLVTR